MAQTHRVTRVVEAQDSKISIEVLCQGCQTNLCTICQVEVVEDAADENLNNDNNNIIISEKPAIEMHIEQCTMWQKDNVEKPLICPEH